MEVKGGLARREGVEVGRKDKVSKKRGERCRGVRRSRRGDTLCSPMRRGPERIPPFYAFSDSRQSDLIRKNKKMFFGEPIDRDFSPNPKSITLPRGRFHSCSSGRLRSKVKGKKITLANKLKQG